MRRSVLRRRVLGYLGLWVFLFALVTAFAPRTTNAQQPQWIWATKPAKPNQKAFFRKQLELPAGVKKAQVAVACDNTVTLYLNGERVTSSSEWNTPAHADVTKRLKQGANTFALAGGNDSSTMAGMIMRLDIELSNGKKLTLATDTSWKVTEAETKGWEKPDFDDSAWGKPVSFGNLGVGP